jgi:hypothetical protein
LDSLTRILSCRYQLRSWCRCIFTAQFIPLGIKMLFKLIFCNACSYINLFGILNMIAVISHAWMIIFLMFSSFCKTNFLNSCKCLINRPYYGTIPIPILWEFYIFIYQTILSDPQISLRYAICVIPIVNITSVRNAIFMWIKFK